MFREIDKMLVEGSRNVGSGSPNGVGPMEKWRFGVLIRGDDTSITHPGNIALVVGRKTGILDGRGLSVSITGVNETGFPERVEVLAVQQLVPKLAGR
jgi:hypothetical protein